MSKQDENKRLEETIEAFAAGIIGGIKWMLMPAHVRNECLVPGSDVRNWYLQANDLGVNLGAFLAAVIVQAVRNAPDAIGGTADQVWPDEFAIQRMLAEAREKQRQFHKQQSEEFDRQYEEEKGLKTGNVFVVVQAHGRGCSATWGSAGRTKTYLNKLKIDPSERGISDFFVTGCYGDWRYVITETVGQVILFKATSDDVNTNQMHPL